MVSPFAGTTPAEPVDLPDSDAIFDNNSMRGARLKSIRNDREEKENQLCCKEGSNKAVHAT
jgi:hypothetical protein